MNSSVAKSETQTLAKFVPLLREIGNLKRIRAAESEVSLAAQMFERAWGRINGGENVKSVAVSTVAEAIIAANLGAISTEVLRRANLSDNEIETILLRAFDRFANVLDEKFAVELCARIKREVAENFTANDYETAKFVEKLKRQPRSGATKTGAAKRIFDQPENHAEHCLAVAVGGAILADFYQADFATVFLTGLIHHFHNAELPDSGFAGEELLGEFLPQVFREFRSNCLREVPENLHEEIWHLFAEIKTANAANARAFHAADVFDRVLQMRHHAEANEFTLSYAMEEMELVHAGAVQKFHYDALRGGGLIA